MRPPGRGARAGFCQTGPQEIGGQGSPVQDRRGPATVTERNARRTPSGSHWPRGREGATGRLGSQETSLRSKRPTALVERGLGMHKPIAALIAVFIFLLLVPAAQAAPTEVNVRIEGKTETLFEGPILSDGHNIKGITDTGAP